MRQYIWSKCFSEGNSNNAANQELIDCPSPISDAEAGTILDAYRHSDTLLPNLRTWTSILRVSDLEFDSTRNQAGGLATRIQAATTQ